MTAIAIDFRIAKNRRAAVNLTRHIAGARSLAARADATAEPMTPTPEREAKGDIVSVPIRDLHPADKTNRTIKRVRLTDGLYSAGLSADLQAAGEHYRLAYEAVHASGRSNDIPRPGSGVQAARTTITDGQADASQRLKRLDRIVGLQCLRIVQQIAGEGRSLRDAHKGGKSRKLASARLRIGLGRLARWLGK